MVCNTAIIPARHRQKQCNYYSLHNTFSSHKDIVDNVTENNAVEENVIGENTTEDKEAEVKNVVYPVSIWTVQTQLHDSLKFYAEMGQALPLPDVQPAYEQEIKEFEESDSDEG